MPRYVVAITETTICEIDRARDTRNLLVIEVAQRDVDPLKRAIMDCLGRPDPEGT